MADRIDLNNKQFVQSLITEIKTGERLDRQRAHLTAYQVYRGAVKRKVQDRLAKTRPKSYKKMTVSDVSISKVVNNKKAQAYKNVPIRSVSGDAEKSSAYQNLMNEMQGHRFWKEFDEIFNLQLEALMWLRFDPMRGRYFMTALAPYEYSLVRDKDNGIVEVVILHYPGANTVAGTGQGDGKSDILAESQDDGAWDGDTYALWTKDQHVVVRARKEDRESFGADTEVKVNIDFVPIPSNPNNVNPLGVLPFAYLSKDNSVDNPYFNPITEQTITWNEMNSITMTASMIQGTGQYVLKYPESMQGNMDNISMGMHIAVELPQKEAPGLPSTDAQFISPNPDLQGMLNVQAEYLSKVLKEQGIFSSQGVGGDSETFSSALERAVANADVQSLIESNQMLYQSVEKDVFEIFKAWDRLMNRLNNVPRVTSDEDTLKVVYQKPKVLISDTDILNNIEKKMRLGLMSRAHALQAIDPNLSEEEAEELLVKIDESKMGMASRALGVLNGSRQDIEDDQPGSIESTEV